MLISVNIAPGHYGTTSRTPRRVRVCNSVGGYKHWGWSRVGILPDVGGGFQADRCIGVYTSRPALVQSRPSSSSARGEHCSHSV
jgi:hypothetical protein